MLFRSNVPATFKPYIYYRFSTDNEANAAGPQPGDIIFLSKNEKELDQFAHVCILVSRADETWVTAATESGKSLRVICCDTRTGRVVRNIRVFDVDRPGGVHPKNGHASPTPILAANRIYVHFGANGTACLERSGKIVWKRTL